MMISFFRFFFAEAMIACIGTGAVVLGDVKPCHGKERSGKTYDEDLFYAAGYLITEARTMEEPEETDSEDRDDEPDEDEEDYFEVCICSRAFRMGQL